LHHSFRPRVPFSLLFPSSLVNIFFYGRTFFRLILCPIVLFLRTCPLAPPLFIGPFLSSFSISYPPGSGLPSPVIPLSSIALRKISCSSFDQRSPLFFLHNTPAHMPFSRFRHLTLYHFIPLSPPARNPPSPLEFLSLLLRSRDTVTILSTAGFRDRNIPSARCDLFLTPISFLEFHPFLPFAPLLAKIDPSFFEKVILLFPDHPSFASCSELVHGSALSLVPWILIFPTQAFRRPGPRTRS